MLPKTSFDEVKKYMFEKDSLMKKLGFLIQSPNTVYIRTLTRYKMLVVERHIRTIEYQRTAVYDVVLYGSTKMGSYHKVICQPKRFPNMYRALTLYLKDFERKYT